jgi:hypothetical protein
VSDKSQWEHSKHRIEIWNDIFAHTDRRIVTNQEKLLNLFNKKPMQGLNDENKNFKSIVQKDISYPINYVPQKTLFEQDLQTQQLKK